MRFTDGYGTPCQASPSKLSDQDKSDGFSFYELKDIIMTRKGTVSNFAIFTKRKCWPKYFDGNGIKDYFEILDTEEIRRSKELGLFKGQDSFDAVSRAI
eukprot:7731387-Ditylum_brightwellii.AAC.1